MNTVLKRFALFCAAIFILSACASAVGKKIASADVAAIHRGKTTMAEIQQKFGPPMGTSMTSEGLFWIYHFQSGITMFSGMSLSTGGDSTNAIQVQDLTVLFGEDNIVKDYRFKSQGSIDPPAATPAAPAVPVAATAPAPVEKKSAIAESSAKSNSKGKGKAK